jgi:replicative DNA helicase
MKDEKRPITPSDPPQIAKLDGPPIVLASDKNVEIEEMRKASAGVPKVMTGFSVLDDCIEGFREGQLIVLSGPTGHGKTALSRTLTKRFVDGGHKVVWFSYEESYEELFDKMPSLEFYVPDTLEQDTIEWVKKMALRAKNERGCNIVFIDNLDFLRNPKEMRQVNMNMSAYVGGIVQELKSFCTREKMIIFLLVHITKQNWNTNALPTSQDIRDSGMIPQLASHVMFIIRKRADGTGEQIFTDEAIVGIDKNRHNGKTKRAFLRYNGLTKMFEEDAHAAKTKQLEANW